jgi:hypothetical protein
MECRIVLHFHVLLREQDATVRELAAIQVNRAFLSSHDSGSRNGQDDKANT